MLPFAAENSHAGLGKERPRTNLLVVTNPPEILEETMCPPLLNHTLLQLGAEGRSGISEPARWVFGGTNWWCKNDHLRERAQSELTFNHQSGQ